ncbi:hypothetical protein ES708_13511 [subsurface metagenome]
MFVYVIKQLFSFFITTLSFIKEKHFSSLSPFCSFRFLKLIDLPSILAGVPVFILPTSNPISFNCFDKPYEAGSDALPPIFLTFPTYIIPFINVPLVIMTLFPFITVPIFVFTPTALLFFTTISSTVSCQKSSFSILSSFSLQTFENFILSFCALGLHIAGPFDLLSILNCIMLSSVTIPLYPPKASISLIICPFAIPPIAGLQDISAIFVISIVISNTLEPIFAAAAAASHPACPAPITITSYSFIFPIA